MGYCDKSRVNSDYPPPSFHNPLAWFVVWSQSENYADFPKCLLLLPGCVMPSTYPKMQKWRFIVCLISQRKPLYSHHILSLWHVLNLIYRFYSLPICPTTKCKLSHLSTPFFLTKKDTCKKKIKKKDTCWYQEVMLFSLMLKCAITLPIWSWNYKKWKASLLCNMARIQNAQKAGPDLFLPHIH